MFFDIIVVLLLVLAVIKGFRRGLIVGILSFIAIIIGLAAAMKLSIIVAGYIGQALKISDTWLPVISFAVVFIIVVLLIRLGANMLQKTAELAMLGWLNRLGGILLYICIYLLIYSVILFYAEQVKLVRREALENSVTYSYIRPLGPWVINGLGTILPFFRDMFEDLQLFFSGIAQKMSSR